MSSVVDNAGDSAEANAGMARVAVSKAATPTREAVRLSAELTRGIYEHAVQCYPEECCGLLLGPADAAPARLVRCTNVQSRRRSRGESDLGARDAFWIDEGQLLTALMEAEEIGEELRAVYHSHVDGAAYLSYTDVACALGPDGVPLYPGVSQLVVSVWDDGVRDFACFDWDAEEGAFVGRGVESSE